jgi:hypothetical protein
MTKTKTTSKKKITKAPAKKKPVKKVVAKKKSVKKKAAPKKAASARKPAARVAKKVTPKKIIRRKPDEAATKKRNTNKEEIKPIVEIVEAPTPLVEKSTEIHEVNTSETAFVPGLDKKSMQQAAIRNYDNHHIRLSKKKGGINPSSKKPLW